MSHTRANHTHRYLIGFVIGVISTGAFFAGKAILSFIFIGEPVACQTSFPRYRTACIYSRFGIGEQAVTFQIDGATVYSTEDFAGGDLRERITWDKTARYVTFYVDGLGDKTYDAETKVLK